MISQIKSSVKMKILPSTLPMVVLNINGLNITIQMQRFPNHFISNYMMPIESILTLRDRRAKERFPMLTLTKIRLACI